MSGGYFDYRQYSVTVIKEEVIRLIENNENKKLGEWGYPTGRLYPKPVINEFEITVKLLKTLEAKIHEIDYLLSDDTGVESFLERIKDSNKI